MNTPFSSILVGVGTGAGMWLICARLQHQQDVVDEYLAIGMRMRVAKFLMRKGIQLKTLKQMDEKKLSSHGVDEQRCKEIMRIVRRNDMRKGDSHLYEIANALSNSSEKTNVPTEMIVVAHSLYEIGNISKTCLKEVTDLFTPYAHPLTPHSSTTSSGIASTLSSEKAPVAYTSEGFENTIAMMQKRLKMNTDHSQYELQAARWCIGHLLSYSQISQSDTNTLTELIRAASVRSATSPTETDITEVMSTTTSIKQEGTMRCILISPESGSNLELQYLHHLLTEDFDVDCSILLGKEASVDDTELVLEELQAEAAWRSEDGSASSGVLRTLIVYQNHGGSGSGIELYGGNVVTEQWLLDRLPPNTCVVVDRLTSLHFFTKTSVDDAHSLTLHLQGSPPPPAPLAFPGYLVPTLSSFLLSHRGVPVFLSDCVRSVQLKFQTVSVPIQGVPAAPFHQRIV